MVAKSDLFNTPLLYRVWQFFQALIARPLSEADMQEVVSVLSPAQQGLYLKMEATDQQHSLGVMRTLAGNGHRHHDLLVAALLHDVGKAHLSLGLLERSLVVLAHFFRPSLAKRWGRQKMDESLGWKRPFVVYEKHPVWGAEMAQAVGCSPLVVQLIHCHHDETAPSWSDQHALDLLRFLQKADSVN